jgi:hypothetical protein
MFYDLLLYVYIQCGSWLATGRIFGDEMKHPWGRQTKDKGASYSE